MALQLGAASPPPQAIGQDSATVSPVASPVELAHHVVRLFGVHVTTIGFPKHQPSVATTHPCQ